MTLLKEQMKENRIGQENKSFLGTTMKIIEYNNSTDITVQFLDEFMAKVQTTYAYFKKGCVRNPYGRYVYGVGIVGNEDIYDENGDLSFIYRMWSNMIGRCYNNSGRDRDISYLDCEVDERWHLYKNFKEWVCSQENYEQWKSLDKKGIDKDILIKGNRIYSPDTCCLVPGYINNLFTKHDKKRGKYCIGVSYHKRDHVFTGTCHNPFTNKFEHLGYFKTEEEAFLQYKLIKETIIQRAAKLEFNKGTITKQCYNSMMKYQVEITD